MVDLVGRRMPPEDAVKRMADALIHRGPDEEGFLIEPGIALASRRLSIIGVTDGRQPVKNEDGNVHVVFNGELFDYVERRAELSERGHELRTSSDTEIIPHLWEEQREGVFECLRGQFAVALWDAPRRQLTLARDRFGISPLYWTKQGDWLLFASEIKGLLASGMVDAKVDRRGINHVFSFSAMPGPITCFEGVSLLGAGKMLQVTNGEISQRAFWEMDFPDAGQEDDSRSQVELVDKFDELLTAAVKRRLRADVPVGSYLSGGVDSSMIVALATKVHGKNVSTYTIRVDDPKLDELSAASLTAKHVGAKEPIVHNFRSEDALSTYPKLIQAVEAPVIDTSCAALLQLAEKVNECGQKVVLTGEGADEWLLGYPWYKISKALGYLDSIPGLKLSDLARRAYLRANKVPQFPRSHRRELEVSAGGPNAWIDSYGLLGLSKLRFYGPEMRELMVREKPWDDLGLNLDRARKWDPVNRGVWMAGRVTLAGHLLISKGDRVAMASSVEARYPFLDETVFDFLATLPPQWKLRGFRDKHLLRLLAERYLPEKVYKRGKVIFRAPLDSFHVDPAPKWVDQLLSEDSLKRTGYFDVEEVRRWRKDYGTLKAGSMPRLSVEMGLVAVVATQLWHHQFLGGDLME